MNIHLRDARDFLVSLKLTLALLAFSLVLVFVATLDQVNLGIWTTQEKYFRSWVVYMPVAGFVFPVFPGGYAIGSLLLLNLVAAHAYRFAWNWRKAGLLLVHAGLILLLVGELLSGLWQQDFQLRLDEGETRNYAESVRHHELVLIDTSHPDFDEVVAIPEQLLIDKVPITHPKLPFRLATRAFYPNSVLHVRPENGPPTLATAGVGLRVLAAPQLPTAKSDEPNLPVAFVELIGPGGSLGTYLVSLQIAVPQTFEHAGRTWRIELRRQRAYYPFSLTLLDFSHDRYPGTEIPKNFSSRIRLQAADPRDSHEALIYMNNPLRHAGLTFYQAGFENNDRTTVLHVVRNPSWLIPYVACTMMAAGLLLQFGVHLVGFVGRRAGAKEVTPVAPGPVPSFIMTGFAGTALLVLLTLAVVAATWRAPRHSSRFDLKTFGEAPVLVNGRVKPLDTVARTTLLMLQGRQRVTTPEGARLTPPEWLLDVFFRPESADAYQVFEIVHPEVLTLLNLTSAAGAGGKRFSLQQMKAQLPVLDAQARLAQETPAEAQTPFQRGVIKLRNAVLVYQRLQGSLNAVGVEGFLATLANFARRPGGDGEKAALAELSAAFRVMDTFGYLWTIPPAPGAAPTEWLTAGKAWQAALAAGRVDEAAAHWATLGRAWQTQEPETFAAAAHGIHQRALAHDPAALTRPRIETRFNAAQPFYTSAVLYLVTFLAAVASWLRWRDPLRRAATIVMTTAFILTTVGIIIRMWLEQRPPVTNLYSSALFVGWGAVALCLVLELVYRNAIGAATAGVIGFATLLIAHHLALGGDTLEMMRAVLDSNFWLATHVVTVTIGYAATFLAGFLGLLYILRGVFTASLDRLTADAIARMIYGVVCFATLFSFVGTVLGGIWADQSWGRFWGWDPKENGALLIVVWNALILHARWSGQVRQRGLAALAIFGNVVTAWSWFGVNMLGVGLHSYGFMDAAFWWLVGFAGTQLAVIACAAVPLSRWRSFRTTSLKIISSAPPAAHAAP
jgi:ABC-type transport system involved in cytochrome c biogenesis permease subunit